VVAKVTEKLALNKQTGLQLRKIWTTSVKLILAKKGLDRISTFQPMGSRLLRTTEAYATVLQRMIRIIESKQTRQVTVAAGSK
jgi:hypothetical protein